MRECAFCPNKAALTGEHLISNWVNKLLEGKTHHYSIFQRSYGTRPTTWNDKRLNLRANVVCQKCNSGWMSDIDSEAKAALKGIILNDSPVSILPLGIASIAAFAMKCGFVADYLTRHRRPFFDAPTRYGFAKTLRPPDGVHMWIGRIQQPRGKRSGIYKTRYGNLHPPSRQWLDVYVFTFSIETVLLQLAAVRFIDSLGRSEL